jgi:predicted RNase H-like nuclease
MKLVKALARHAFVHDFNMATTRQRSGRWLFEVYPHPAMVRLSTPGENCSFVAGENCTL